METKISDATNVVTRDGRHLGLARRIFRRRQEINPQLKLYAAYLQTRSLESGEDYYIPTDFIAGNEEGSIILTVDFNKVARETWSRMPDFVAHGDADKEELV